MLDGGSSSVFGRKSYSWHVVKVGDGSVFLHRPFQKASSRRSSRPLSTASGRNPKLIDWMTAALMCRSPLKGVILGGVHRLEGPVDGVYGGAAFAVMHQRRGVLATDA
ncbi:hypothetical protein VPH35_125011 [Triticum aestivum]